MKRDLTGQRIVITGGSSGIGAAAAKALKNSGAQITITGRSSETDRLAEQFGFDAFHVNFGDLADVQKFAKTLLEKYPRIDVLVNNVGGIFNERKLTKDGHESTFQVNHLAGFHLTSLLRSRLEESSPPSSTLRASPIALGTLT